MRCFVVAIAVLGLWSCGKDRPIENISTRHTSDYSPHVPLAEKLASQEWNYCLENRTPTPDQHYQSLVKNALNAWLEKRPGSHPPAEITLTTCENANFKLSAVNQLSFYDREGNEIRGRAYASSAAKLPSITVDNRIDLATLIHELGHLFGLKDTYHEDTSGCRDRPLSIMCQTQIVKIFPVDQSMLTRIFCYHNPGFQGCPIPLSLGWFGQDTLVTCMGQNQFFKLSVDTLGNLSLDLAGGLLPRTPSQNKTVTVDDPFSKDNWMLDFTSTQLAIDWQSKQLTVDHSATDESTLFTISQNNEPQTCQLSSYLQNTVERLGW